jgi:hypothetical protein
MGRVVSQPDPLDTLVYVVDGGYKRFGELSLAEVEARAHELQSATGFGPTARVGGVARAWAQLAREMANTGAATVRQLDGDTVSELAGRAWVVPPRGSLL